MIEVKSYDVLTGSDSLSNLLLNDVGAGMSKKLFPIDRFLNGLNQRGGVFISLKCYSEQKQMLSENLYCIGKSSSMCIVKTNIRFEKKCFYPAKQGLQVALSG
jgi:hypothetical protein